MKQYLLNISNNY